MITLQGYLKTRISAMGARINERKCKNLRASQIKVSEKLPLFPFPLCKRRKKEERIEKLLL
jgi:hypothetical protein